MSQNPYEPPPPVGRPTPDVNSIGSVGFFLSLTGVVALFSVRLFGAPAMWVAFASVPGLVLSGVGLFFRPRPLAVWGLTLGIYGSMFLPNLYLAMFHFSSGR